MKGLFLKKNIPLLEVGLCGLLLYVGCGKKEEVISVQTEIIPADTTIANTQSLLIGTWVVCGSTMTYDEPLIRDTIHGNGIDTIAFLPNGFFYDNCDGCGSLNGLRYTLYSDTTIKFGDWNSLFHIKFDGNGDLIIYNWRHCYDISSYSIN